MFTYLLYKHKHAIRATRAEMKSQLLRVGLSGRFASLLLSPERSPLGPFGVVPSLCPGDDFADRESQSWPIIGSLQVVDAPRDLVVTRVVTLVPTEGCVPWSDLVATWSRPL